MFAVPIYTDRNAPCPLIQMQTSTIRQFVLPTTISYNVVALILILSLPSIPVVHPKWTCTHDDPFIAIYKDVSHIVFGTSYMFTIPFRNVSPCLRTGLQYFRKFVITWKAAPDSHILGTFSNHKMPVTTDYFILSMKGNLTYYSSIQ